ncbi:outer membrane porin, OprD family [Endozoicomonas sp. SM1973]|uniref:Outer membrane porin, OprD family n=1 Tax=Spartinivicinus marinus TaxID=2994442 RepID=A0A853ICM5_9GAMM|nr:OprD family outer membrane porin [Spartinivicinus marinus]MCX4025670.1 OprD family outer membrane porin [Spartinivicinus marinus]NYZ68308.1 outer membrane porin, OprD family [Spartinivicinus marinus]
MHIFKRTALCTAIVAASSFNMVTHADEGFIEGSSLDAVLRNVYFNRDGRHGSDYDNREWIQGLQLNYTSGYFADIIGFDASYYGAWDLDSPGNNFTHLPADGRNPKETNDISLLGQAYVKVKLGDDDLNFNFKHGRMRRDTNLIQGSGSRAVPSSVYGTAADINVHGLKLHGTYLTEGSWRNMGHFEHFGDGTEEVNYIQSYGLAYEFDNGLGFEYDWGESNSFLEGQQFKVYHTFSLADNTQLYLEGIHHRVKENGDAFIRSKINKDRTAAQAASFDGYDSQNTQLLAKLTVDELTLKTAYHQTKGADFEYDWAASPSGFGGFNSMVPYWSDFICKDQKAIMVGFEYDFAGVGVPGLTLEAGYRKGFDGDKNNTGIETTSRGNKEWGRDTTIAYEFQTAALKGLKLKWTNYTHREASGLKNEDIDNNQIYIDYTFNIF